MRIYVVMLSIHSHLYILGNLLTGTGAIVWLLQCLRSNPDGYVYVKAFTSYIFQMKHKHVFTIYIISPH